MRLDAPVTRTFTWPSRRAGSIDSLRRPGATAGQHVVGPDGHGSAIDLRVVADVDRQHAAASAPRRPGARPARRTASVEAVLARPGSRRRVLEHDDELLDADRTDADRGRASDTRARARPTRSIGTGVIGPRLAVDDVDECDLRPTAARHRRDGRRRPNGARRPSPSTGRAAVLRVPQVEVAVGHPRRGTRISPVLPSSASTTAGSTIGPMRPRPAGRRTRRRRGRRAVAASIAGEVDVGDRQRLGHAVRACAATPTGRGRRRHGASRAGPAHRRRTRCAARRVRARWHVLRRSPRRWRAPTGDPKAKRRIDARRRRRRASRPSAPPAS